MQLGAYGKYRHVARRHYMSLHSAGMTTDCCHLVFSCVCFLKKENKPKLALCWNHGISQLPVVSPHWDLTAPFSC